jgi:glutamate/tyrosine decarboxylase-like PLP-dependent enzyme
MEPRQLRTLLLDAAERSSRYLASLDERGVAAASEAVESLLRALDGPQPERPLPPAEVLGFLDELGSPATVASAGGRYFGFVTGGSLPATLAANWLAGAWDQNAFSFVSSPAASLFEETALRWIKAAVGLPDSAAGALVTGATMANFTCLAAARHRVLQDAGWDVEERGLTGAPKITVIVGDEVHATLLKVFGLLGLGRADVVRVPVDDQGRMRADALPAISGPAVVCLQAGNVNSGAFDPFAEIIPRLRQSRAWIHVDAAFGLWAAASPAFAEPCRGLDLADSWATDAHKWLNVPYDCGLAVVRDEEALARAMSIHGAYLLPSERRDAIDFTPDSSRRARAVEVWAALASLGRQGLRELVERNCRQARRFAEGLVHAGAEVLNDVVLNQVVVAFGDDERTREVIRRVQASGECWCGGTRWHDREAMRISVSCWRTSDADVERSLEAIVAAMASRRGGRRQGGTERLKRLT